MKIQTVQVGDIEMAFRWDGVPDGPVIMTLKMSAFDQHALVASGQLDAYFEFMNHLTEAIFQVLDATTRRTGFITKTVRVVNLQGATPSAVNRQFVKADSQRSAELQTIYPQTLQSMVIIHMPAPIRFMYNNVIKHLLPRKVTDKVVMVDLSSAAQAAEMGTKHGVSLEDVPAWFGGTSSGERPIPFLFESAEVAGAREVAWQSLIQSGCSPQQVFEGVDGVCAAQERGAPRQADGLFPSLSHRDHCPDHPSLRMANPVSRLRA